MDTNHLMGILGMFTLAAFISFMVTGIAMVTKSYLFDFCFHVTAGLILAGAICGFVWAGITLYREQKAKG